MADLLRLSTGSPGVSGKGKAQSKGRKKKKKKWAKWHEFVGSAATKKKRGEECHGYKWYSLIG